MIRSWSQLTSTGWPSGLVRSLKTSWPTWPTSLPCCHHLVMTPTPTHRTTAKRMASFVTTPKKSSGIPSTGRAGRSRCWQLARRSESGEQVLAAGKEYGVFKEPVACGPSFCCRLSASRSLGLQECAPCQHLQLVAEWRTYLATAAACGWVENDFLWRVLDVKFWRQVLCWVVSRHSQYTLLPHTNILLWLAFPKREEKTVAGWTRWKGTTLLAGEIGRYKL